VMNRWLDFNDTWLAAEWGHPSDNFAGILAVADYLSQQRAATGMAPLTLRDVLVAGIQAYEIQGVLALENAFNAAGLDHVLLVKLASTAVITRLLGGDRDALLSATSNAWMDGGTLRVYRHAPNTGSRKSWAAGDASARAVRLALLALKGEMSYPAVLSARTWGWQTVFFADQPVQLARPFGAYVMENILFKVAYPAEFHAQTAVEAALALHPQVAERLDDIAAIRITTQAAGQRIIDKRGPLANPADRDHCLQYMVAVPLITGALTAASYSDAAAADPRIDALRARMTVVEDPQFSRDYLDPAKRSIANGIAITFRDSTTLGPLVVDYPLGHRRRRAEGLPLLDAKLRANLATHLPAECIAEIMALHDDPSRFDAMPVPDFMELWLP
jgi:2-methylcitrate dehydratase